MHLTARLSLGVVTFRVSRLRGHLSDAVPFLGAAMKDGATKGGATRSAFKGKQFTSTVPRAPAAAGEGLFSKKTYEYAAEPFVEAPAATKKEESKLGCVMEGTCRLNLASKSPLLLPPAAAPP